MPKTYHISVIDEVCRAHDAGTYKTLAQAMQIADNRHETEKHVQIRNQFDNLESQRINGQWSKHVAIK